MKTKRIIYGVCIIVMFVISSCEDFLEKKPVSDITPDDYLTNDGQLGTYAINLYSVFPTTSYGIFGQDVDTDVSAGLSYHNKYIPGQFKVGQSGGDWSFTSIAQCNYFFERVLPGWKNNKITGTNVNHYIGEVYFLRAYNYFNALKALGDFPIIKKSLTDNRDILTAASKRAPRNEVARFIISDLDSAILLMNNVSPDGKRNRLSKTCAQLFKSRVALYEGTWLKYFKGTAFVPNGQGWPGKEKDYNANYAFPSGSIDAEIEYFLDQAMTESKIVADATLLEPNSMTQQLQQTDKEFAEASMANPYCAMFSSVDLSGYKEVLFWRAYSFGLQVMNDIAVYAQKGNGCKGLTRGMVDGFLMTNGLPIYAIGSGYQGDDLLSLVRKNRDGRLWLFLKQPGQINILIPSAEATHANPVEGYPAITNLTTSEGYFTGYHTRKGLNYNAEHCIGNGRSFIGVPIFRAVEAYLNYIEASYEKNGTIDAVAQSYWQQIRTRAGVDINYQKTIDATDLSVEATNDWAVYSAGTPVNTTLYNIRRERRCELIEEGLRDMDLHRWRSMDQMIATPYNIEGFKLWGPMQNWYGAGILTYNIGDKSTVSSPTRSAYLRVYEKTPTSLVFNGYRWHMSHYLNPIALQHFLITSVDNVVSTSPIYQNPGWPIEANVGPVN